MGTQAVIGVRQDGEVKFKIVAGCNGDKSADLIAWLHSNPDANAQEIYDAAQREGLGCEECLVVQVSPSNCVFRGEGEIHEPGSLYAEKFSDPMFNPRWKEGTACYHLLLDLPATVV